jgi:flagellar biosynthesis protein FliP
MRVAGLWGRALVVTGIDTCGDGAPVRSGCGLRRDGWGAAPVLLTGVLALVLTLALAGGAQSQELTLRMGDGEGESLALRSLQLLTLLTVLSLVPGLAIMITCFPFLVTVLAILRQAIGLQQSPPGMLLTTLALFLTYFVMEPVFLAAWEAAAVPLQQGEIDIEVAVLAGLEPFRAFMLGRVDAETFANLAMLRPDPPPLSDQAPLSVLIPSFLLSELSRAFQIGFVIFLPFLIIDLVVAAVLMSMGMMMVPPAIVSLPFKLAFFVVADGWSLIASALVQGYF